MNLRQGLAALLASGAATAVLAGPAAHAPAGGAPHYHVAARFPIGGTDTGYDYLKIDPTTHRLYVAHGTRVEVLDENTGAKVGEIAPVPGAHGIEFPEGSSAGFATSGQDRTVVMFDRHSLKVLKTIRYTGVKPDALAFDPSSRLLFVANGATTGDVTAIDPVNGAIVGTVDLRGGKLEGIAFDGHGRGFVNDEKQNAVHVFDTKTLEPVASWPLAPGEEPTGLAIDPVGGRIYAACGNKLLIALDAHSGRVLAQAPIGADPDGAAFDAGRELVLTSNFDGTLSVVRAKGEALTPLETVTTAPGARTLALDEATGRVFLPLVQFEAKSGQASERRPSIVPGTFGVMVLAP